MPINPIVPVILCGGSGTRLWPLSRKSFPKQYLKLSNTDNTLTLLQNTYERVSEVRGIKSPILICNEDHRFIAAEQMRKIDVKPYTILLEPFGKNTAPAIALAALLANQIEDDCTLLVLSSDHEIKNNKKFLETVNKGIHYANNNKLVTFGVIPNKAETGYGYIKAKEAFDLNKIEGHNIEEFIEKPNQKKASEYIKDNRYTWNSGIFLFKSKIVISELETFCPKVIQSCKKSLKNSTKDFEFQRLSKADFEECPDLSFDIAVMEKTKKGIVLPLNAGWSDIGSWKSLWENSIKDDKGNFTEGNVIQYKTKNCYLSSQERLIATLGLKNLIVIDTNDAILVADNNETQNIKYIVDELKSKGIKEWQENKEVFRPWGSYISLVEDSRWKVKLIKVNPGKRLSLQLHHHRSEHWVVVKGTAKVEINGKDKLIHENQSTYIPVGSQHRLSNPGKILIELIEIQSGSYLGEDDIHRINDDFGR